MSKMMHRFAIGTIAMAVILIAGLSFAAPRVATISLVRGNVEVQKAGENAWKGAVVKAGLSIQDKVRTGNDGKCELTLDDGSLIKLRENTTMQINDLSQDDSTKKKSSVFMLLLGKLFAKVTPQEGSKFEVATPAAVAGVRGTEFAITCKIDGFTDVLVFKGKIEFKNFKDELGEMRSTMVVEGQAFGAGISGEIGLPRDLTPQEQQEWKDAIQSMGKGPVKVIVLTPEEKAAFKKEVAEIKKDLEENRIAGMNIKKSDFAAGRTVRDHAGVLCRTEQAVFRPTADEICILNMTTRGTPSPENLNYIQGTMVFNGALSADIVDAAKDIASQKVDLVKTELEASNAAPSVTNRDLFVATYDVVTDQGSMKYNDVVVKTVGNPQTESSDSAFKSKTTLGIDIDNSGTADGNLYVNNWVLNNAGKVLGKSDFAADPGQLLNMLRNDVTFEVQLDFSELSSLTRKDGIIDVIIIPDVMFQMFDMALKEAGNMGINIDLSEMNNNSGND